MTILSIRLLVVAVGVLASQGAFAEDVVWTGDRIVDSPVTICRQRLRIEPGSRIAFKGEGRIRVEDADLVISRAILEARTTLTNNFRLAVQKGRIMLSDSRFRGLKAEKPSPQSFIFGFLYCRYGNDSRVEGNTFENCDALMMLNACHAEFARNLVVGCNKAFAMLNCAECRLEGNEFFDSTEGINLNSTRLSEVFCNRFTDCPIGVILYSCKENRAMGNAFFGGVEGFQLWGLGPGGMFSGNRFEDVKYPFSRRGACDGRNVFRDNGVDFRL